MSKRHTTAIVVTYNSRTTIESTTRSIREAYKEGILECIVVDNNSQDGTSEFLSASEPWGRILRNSENQGFARACNLGFREVCTPYVLLLNPDAALELEALSAMIAFLEQHPRAGIIGPAITGPSGQLQHAGGRPTPARIVLQAAGFGGICTDRRTVYPGAAPFRTNWLSGSILLIRKSLLDETGGFDPRFFLYFEETDLFHRALDCGWEVWALGEATGQHLQGASTQITPGLQYDGCLAEHFFRSRFYYWVKHYGWAQAVAAEITEFFLMGLRSVFRAGLGRGWHPFAVRVRSPFMRQPPKVS